MVCEDGRDEILRCAHPKLRQLSRDTCERVSSLSRRHLQEIVHEQSSYKGCLVTVNFNSSVIVCRVSGRGNPLITLWCALTRIGRANYTVLHVTSGLSTFYKRR